MRTFQTVSCHISKTYFVWCQSFKYNGFLLAPNISINHQNIKNILCFLTANFPLCISRPCILHYGILQIIHRAGWGWSCALIHQSAWLILWTADTKAKRSSSAWWRLKYYDVPLCKNSQKSVSVSHLKIFLVFEHICYCTQYVILVILSLSLSRFATVMILLWILHR